MGVEGWYTLGIVATIITVLVRNLAPPDMVMMAGLFALAAPGVLTPTETFAGFSSQAVATVGALFIVSAALRETGALDLTLGRLFGRSRHERSVLLRTLPPLAALSGFLNSAPLVAMMTPVFTDWARRSRLSASKILIPLSYASILGSTTTVIGTSVTLTVAGLVTHAEMPPIRMFELAPVGISLTLVGLIYLVAVAPRLLPDRRDPADELYEHRREYTAALLVEPHCALVGRSVEEAGLRNLPGLYLIEIARGEHVLTPVGPDEILAAGDHLVFAGVVATLVDLQRIRGLVPLDQADEPEALRARRRPIEAVISPSSPLVNRSIKEANFRAIYDAAVVAVHRNGERVAGKLGDIVLRAGDTLLMQAAPSFLSAHHGSLDFYLVSEIQDANTPRHDRDWVAIGVTAAMVLAAASGLMPISIASFLACGTLIATRCIRGAQARASVQWSVLVVIACGLGIAAAMQKTGAAGAIASVVTATAGPLGPLATLAAVYAMCLVLSESLSHNAAVAVAFPIAIAAAEQVGADPRPFVIATIIGGSCAFASPVTYQTHLIVYGPGGYRFTDFVKVGLPLDLVCAAVALVVIPWVWPL
jgi:di/tricarboxylate transporter